MVNKYASKNVQRDTGNQAGEEAARWIIELMMKMEPAKIEPGVRNGFVFMKSGLLSDIACGPW